MTDEEAIDEKLLSSLNKICCDLISTLHKTETMLLIEKLKYERVTDICKPWPIKNNKSSEHSLQCTCSDITTLPRESKDNNTESFIGNIPSIVSRAKALRQSPYNSTNCNKKYSSTKKSIRETKTCSKPDNSVPKLDKNKSKSFINDKSCTSFQSLMTKTSKSTHNPSCSLYGFSATDPNRTNSVSNLSDAISMYGVPDRLNRTLKCYYKFVLENDQQDIVVTKTINAFLKYCNKQNNETWKIVEENVEKMPKYMLALNSIEKGSSNQAHVPCIIYHNIEDLIVLEKCKNELNEKEMWHGILKYLNRDFTEILLQCNLTKSQKIYICKLLQAVCNFSSSRILKIPIFRIKNS